MRILYYFPYDGSFMTEWQRVHIFNEMVHYGVEFEIFNPLSFRNFHEANEKLIDRIRNNKEYVLFMNCASSDMLFPETMKELQKYTIPKLLICFDNLHAPFMHKSIAPYFDLVWLTSKETEAMFVKWGCNTIFQPYAANPFLFEDSFVSNQNRVAFVGTPYGTRSLRINSLINNNIPCEVFYSKLEGNKKIENSLLKKIRNVTRLLRFDIGEKVLYSRIKFYSKRIALDIHNPNLFLSKSLSFSDVNKVYSNYALSLNIIELLTTIVLKTPIHKLHLRTFEIPMSYGLELVASNNELHSYFSEEEMIFYKDQQELVDKASFYIKPQNDSLCRKMKLKARYRAESEHCWKNRFDVVFNKLNLSNVF